MGLLPHLRLPHLPPHASDLECQLILGPDAPVLADAREIVDCPVFDDGGEDEGAETLEAVCEDPVDEVGWEPGVGGSRALIGGWWRKREAAGQLCTREVAGGGAGVALGCDVSMDGGWRVLKGGKTRGKR